jgi:hypothetical protein
MPFLIMKPKLDAILINIKPQKTITFNIEIDHEIAIFVTW